MSIYKEPNDYGNIYEFMDQYRDNIHQGRIEDGLMMKDVYDFILEVTALEFRHITIQLRRLYTYLLKYKYQPIKQTKSWIDIIRDTRLEIDEALNNNFLKNKIDQNYQKTVFLNARKDAIAETQLSKYLFPESITKEYKLYLISDSEYIESYLRKYACSMEAKKELDL